MIYFSWFEALKALLFGANAEQLTPEQHKGLFFLGNMLMPEETQLIRLGAENPKSFDLSVAPLAKRPDLFGDGFYLPGTGVVVEDAMSAIGLVDLDRNRSKGLGSPRLFLSIETTVSLRKGPAPSTLSELLKFASVQLEYPEETFFLVWGVIDSVTDLNIVRRPVGVQLSPWGVAVFDKNQLYFSKFSDWFVKYLNREQAVPSSDPAFEEMVSRLGEPLVQNLSFALLQVAYSNALVEEGRRDSGGKPGGEEAG